MRWQDSFHDPNAQPGPSRLPEQQNDVSRAGSTSTEPAAKRPRISRLSKACHSCRVRKRKCGGTPPNACPNCIKGGNECSWPLEDGRASSARKSRALTSKGLRETSTVSEDAPSPWTLATGEDWFQGLGDLSSFNDNSLQMQATLALPSYNPPTADPSIFNPFTTPLAQPAHVPQPDEGVPPLDLGLDSQHAPLNMSQDAEWPADFDSFEFIMAMSSRMPMVEASTRQDTSPGTDFSPNAVVQPGERSNVESTTRNERKSGKVVQVTWWRPHGQTAIAPGLKKMTLKVRLNEDSRGDRYHRSPAATSLDEVGPVELFDADRAPHPAIMRHLMDLFRDQFGPQFPSVDCAKLLAELESGNGSVFLLNCIAATSARFSSHPALALSHLKPHEYGNVFYNVAKDMLGSMLSVPSRETIIALLLLCQVAFANNSEAEEWMFCGMAVRLAVDVGLHLEPGDDFAISAEDRRLNRLVFWSVILLDFSLSFGTGRQPTLRVDEITQSLPTDEDMGIERGDDELSHPFPYAAKLMFSYGRLIELLNTRQADLDGGIQKEIQRQRLHSIQEYGSMPPDVRWNVTNLQRHARAGQASIYLQLHLWMHTIIASGFLTGTDYVRRNPPRPVVVPETGTGAVTPGGIAATNVWRNSARTIGDILVLSDIVCPKAYAALPFVNQAFYVAGSCYVKELEQEREAHLALMKEQKTSRNVSPIHREAGSRNESASSDLFKSILATVFTENIGILRKGLDKQMDYWSGVAWVAAALEQRIQGISQEKIDLEEVTGKLITIASVPDAGLLHRATRGASGETEKRAVAGSTQ